jgi:hypothetical protein
MSQPFNIVMTTAEIMRNSYHAGYRVTDHFPRKYDGQYIEFFGMNENGESTGVEYDEEDSIDKKSIKYLMGVLQEICDKNSKYDDYWGC